MRSRFLVLLLVACVGTWLLLRGLKRSYREDQNYSLIEDGLYMGAK